MENNYPKVRWWRLYAIAPAAIALLVLDTQLALPDLGHKLVELLIVLVTAGLMGLWVMANAAALVCSEIAAEQPREVVGTDQDEAGARLRNSPIRRRSASDSHTKASPPAPSPTHDTAVRGRGEGELIKEHLA